MAKSLKNGNVTVSLGNLKVSEKVLLFNLPAIKTCPNCVACATGCYARVAEIQYKVVRESRERNWDASKQPCFVARMVELIERSGVKLVRVHESGDFYSQSYADKWSEIARRLPNVTFFAYTKSPFRPSSPNFNIVESVLPNGAINFGPKGEILALAKKFKAKVCPCGLSKVKVVCGENCTACLRAKYVVFVEHGKKRKK